MNLLTTDGVPYKIQHIVNRTTVPPLGAISANIYINSTPPLAWNMGVQINSLKIFPVRFTFITYDTVTGGSASGSTLPTLSMCQLVNITTGALEDDFAKVPNIALFQQGIDLGIISAPNPDLTNMPVASTDFKSMSGQFRLAYGFNAAVTGQIANLYGAGEAFEIPNGANISTSLQIWTYLYL